MAHETAAGYFNRFDSSARPSWRAFSYARGGAGVGTTPNYAWPYPELNSPPDGATQIKALALAVEPTVKTNADNVAANTATLAIVQNPPVLRMHRATALSVPSSSTPMAVPFPVKDEDSTGMANVNGDAFTVKKAGLWLISVTMSYDFNATGPRYVAIMLGANMLGSQAVPAITQTGWATSLAITVQSRLAVDNIVTVTTGQLSGAALTTSTVYFPQLGMIWLRS
jgi:hypothetical protein